jgi:hypothetical protein
MGPGTTTTIINKFGRMSGWNSITTNFLGRDLEGINSLKYDDNVAKENVYGAGKYAIGRTEGNYEANCEVGLYKEEFSGLLLSLPPGKRIQDIEPFDITVVYELPSGVIQTDIIRNAEFTNMGIDVKQADGSIVTVFKLIISHIDWAVV